MQSNKAPALQVRRGCQKLRRRPVRGGIKKRPSGVSSWL